LPAAILYRFSASIARVILWLDLPRTAGEKVGFGRFSAISAEEALDKPAWDPCRYVSKKIEAEDGQLVASHCYIKVDEGGRVTLTDPPEKHDPERKMGTWVNGKVRPCARSLVT
jgi:hypothetical protein